MPAAQPVTDADLAAAAANSSLKATVAGGSILSVGGLTANDVAIYGGLILALAGFVMQWYYQRRRDQREQSQRDESHREHVARMSQLEEGELR